MSSPRRIGSRPFITNIPVVYGGFLKLGVPFRGPIIRIIVFIGVYIGVPLFWETTIYSVPYASFVLTVLRIISLWLKEFTITSKMMCICVFGWGGQLGNPDMSYSLNSELLKGGWLYYTRDYTGTYYRAC